MKARTLFIVLALGITLFIGALSAWHRSALWLYLPVGPFLLIGVYDLFQTKHSLRRNFPLIGRGRWLMESLRPPMHQYFVEDDLAGTPINRMFRSVVYQRSTGALDTNPFGTKINVYGVGYEWTNHSLNALSKAELDANPRVRIGGPDCRQPYNAALLNISAMSYGALSKNAIMALNGGAKIGNFAHNTGEGGLSDFHLEPGGDLIWQIGTAYFGCRTKDGRFDEEKFSVKVKFPSVKMVEIKLSQGAKPGHGGILPAGKNTEEIARMRGVEPHTEVVSPPTHSAFSGPEGLIHFIQKLRNLSDGKPIGFKLCVGNKSEFIQLARTMRNSGITPDFITVDGGEGGTGAAPLELSNSVGMPLREGLVFVHDVLVGFGLRDKIKIICSGKIFTAFHIFRAKALGADLCYSARGMMLALGCIQALECNKNNCPTGVATQDPDLVKGLVVTDKKQRVARFQSETIESFAELLGTAGVTDHHQINRSMIYRRVSSEQVKRLDEIYQPMREGGLLECPYPEDYRIFMEECDAREERRVADTTA